MINSFLNKVMFSKSFFDRYHSEFLPEMMGMHLSVAKLILRKPCIHYVLYGQEVLSDKILCVCVGVCVCVCVCVHISGSVCNPIDCSSPDSSVPKISQTRILGLVPFPNLGNLLDMLLTYRININAAMETFYNQNYIYILE